MADEIDRGQQSGEVPTQDRHGRGIQTSVQGADTQPATYEDLDIDRRRVVEWQEAVHPDAKPE